MIGEADADLILLDDGGDHTEDTNTIDYYEIYDGPASDPTTVTFNTGAVVNGFNLDDQSVYIADTSELLINDGIFSEDVTVCGMASGEIHGGTFQDDLNAESSGIILFYGGLVIDDVEAVGSSRIDIFGGSFHHADHITHTEDTAGHTFGVEYVELVEFFTFTDKFDRFTCDLTHGQGCTTTGITVEFGEDNTCNAYSIVKVLCYRNGLLSRGGVGYE